MKKLGMAARKSVSRFRSFKTIADQKLQELRKTQLKRRTEAKMLWGVRAFKEWRTVKLSSPDTYDVRILISDLDCVENLDRNAFEFAMCKFLAEVVKVKDGSEYPGRTLYQFVVAIQKYLVSKGLHWKLIDGEFSQLRTVLDNLMKERAAQNIGNVVKRAEMLSFEEENLIWEKGVLGDSNPTQVRETVLFMLGVHVGLRAGDERYNLRRESDKFPSQLSFKRDNKGIRCLVYTEDSVTKTNDGGLKSMGKECKVVWVYRSSNTNRCPVRIVHKYMSLLPPVRQNKKDNFYLRSLDRLSPAQWYGEQVVGLNTIRKVLQTLEESANLQGFFTNHSLRRTGTMRLFQAGVDRKLVKEFTGHSSDVVDKYQVTSNEQRKHLSEVISGDNCVKSTKTDGNITECNFELAVGQSESSLSCACSKKVLNVQELSDIGKVIDQLVSKKRGSKATVKLSIEFDC